MKNFDVWLQLKIWSKLSWKFRCEQYHVLSDSYQYFRRKGILTWLIIASHESFTSLYVHYAFHQFKKIYMNSRYEFWTYFEKKTAIDRIWFIEKKIIIWKSGMVRVFFWANRLNWSANSAELGNSLLDAANSAAVAISRAIHSENKHVSMVPLFI